MNRTKIHIRLISVLALLAGSCQNMLAMQAASSLAELLKQSNSPELICQWVVDSWQGGRPKYILNISNENMPDVTYDTPSANAQDRENGQQLKDWFMKDFLREALFGTGDEKTPLRHLEHLDGLHTTYSGKRVGIFGYSSFFIVQATTTKIECAILRARGILKSGRGLYQTLAIPDKFKTPQGYRELDSFIYNVGCEIGEDRLLTGRMPLKWKLYSNRYGLGIVACVAGAIAGGMYYWYLNKQKDKDADEDASQDEKNNVEKL